MDGAAALLAVTMIVVLVDTTGAVSNPVPEMAPPVVVQVTAWLEVLATVAVNCRAPPEVTVVEVGEIETEMGWGVEG